MTPLHFETERYRTQSQLYRAIFCPGEFRFPTHLKQRVSSWSIFSFARSPPDRFMNRVTWKACHVNQRFTILQKGSGEASLLANHNTNNRNMSALLEIISFLLRELRTKGARQNQKRKDTKKTERKIRPQQSTSEKINTAASIFRPPTVVWLHFRTRCK